MPDPIDSGEYAQADQIIESISQGIESSGPWLRDRFWLPWKDLRPRPPGERQPSEQCRGQVPGVIVFRSSDSSQTRALVLLLVGETPTWGVQKPALAEALDFIEAASGDPDRRGSHKLLPVDVIGPTFSGSAASIRSTLAAPEVSTVVAAITIALFAAHWPSSIESSAMADVALRVALVGAAAGVTVAVASVVVYWRRLERLLARLSNDPMVGGFDRLPKPFVRSLEDQIATAPVGSRGLHTMIRQLELLEANRVESGPPESALGPICVPWPQLLAAKEEQASTGEVAPESVGVAGGPVTECLLRQANALRWYLSTVWSTRSLASAAGSVKDAAGDALTKPTGPGAIPTTLALTNPTISPGAELWLRLAEEYVACVVTLILGHLVRHFRILLTTVTSGVLLLMITVSAYPLQPRRELMAGVWVLTLGAVSASAYALFALERNDLLSRIGKKEPGSVSLDRTFLAGLFMWALIPLLGLLAVQYPEIAGQLFSFLSPASGKSS